MWHSHNKNHPLTGIKLGKDCETLIMSFLFPDYEKVEAVISGQKHTQDSFQVAAFYVAKAGRWLEESSWNQSIILWTLYKAYFPGGEKTTLHLNPLIQIEYTLPGDCKLFEDRTYSLVVFASQWHNIVVPHKIHTQHMLVGWLMFIIFCLPFLPLFSAPLWHHTVSCF